MQTTTRTTRAKSDHENNVYRKEMYQNEMVIEIECVLYCIVSDIFVVL